MDMKTEYIQWVNNMISPYYRKIMRKGIRELYNTGDFDGDDELMTSFVSEEKMDEELVSEEVLGLIMEAIRKNVEFGTHRIEVRTVDAGHEGSAAFTCTTIILPVRKAK